MISLTEEAAEQALQMMEENGISPDSDYGLRLGVESGGCSGLEYVLDIVPEPNDNDRVFEFHGVNVYCDPKSYLYLKGTEIGWQESMTGSGFSFENPNAKRSCGCGTSFAT
ncbi:MAG: HesB/IscA family protein [Bradymonadaceae bacterium]